MRFLLVLLLVLFSNVACSGFLEIRLKSEYRLVTTVVLSKGDNPTYLALPTILQAGKVKKLGPFPVDFNENSTFTILGDRVEQLGINSSTYTSYLSPTRGILSPKQLYLPINGLELVFECDENWTGTKCDVRCSESCDSSKEQERNEMIITTEYSIDTTKLPEIVKRLKQTTRVDNEILKELEKPRTKDVLGTPPPKRDSPKSLILDLFKGIFDHSFAKEASSTDDIPIFMSIGRDDDGPSSFEPLSNPISMFSKMIMKKHESKGSLSKEIERHSNVQKSLGFRHQKPSRFDSWEGPGEGMGAMPLFGPLMSIMPRMGRSVAAEKEGSEALELALDQVIRT
ncbi:hypothetical protein L5515_012839 [Caenorhabditis briggsae]|uniref:Uncharacterized protein n=1 Tax=Caenorhabditis briggsae TaxID=6238 RepID=A0AAE9EY61_CAEBR|nr:hypothetical protein L5515_012839 [Caenorhabditis briggsae]